MSQENLELVRSFWDGEMDMVELTAEGPMPGMAEVLHPDVEVGFITSAPGVPELTYRGLDGFAEGWREWLLPFESYVVEPQSFTEAGDDEVVVEVEVRARTHRDSVVMEHSPAVVCTVRDGKVVLIAFYLEAAEARAAAGLDGPAV